MKSFLLLAFILIAVWMGATLPKEVRSPIKPIGSMNRLSDVDSFLSYFKWIPLPISLPSDSIGWRNLRCFHYADGHRIVGYYKKYEIPPHLEELFLCEFPNLHCVQTDARVSVALGKFAISDSIIGLIHTAGGIGNHGTFLTTFSVKKQRVIAKLLLERDGYRFPQSVVNTSLSGTIFQGKGWNDTSPMPDCDSTFSRYNALKIEHFQILSSGKIIIHS